MESLGVSVANMDKFGTAGVTTISIINCIGVDRQAFIAFIKKEPLDIKSDTVPDTIEQAKVIGVYEAVTPGFRLTPYGPHVYSRRPPQKRVIV